MIQAGVAGSPTGVARTVRVWTDRPRGEVVVRHARTGAPLGQATTTQLAVPVTFGAAGLVRRVFEIANLPSDALIEVEIGGETCRVLTLPPDGAELRLMLGSCFHITEDRGRLWRGYQSLRGNQIPHLRIHAGDQLYLDAGKLPEAPTPFQRSRRRYDDYWGNADYANFLRAGASIFAADDHEFWNDYPYRMPWLSRSWNGQWAAHANAAILFQAYQALGNPGGNAWFELDLGLVSMLSGHCASHRR